MGLDEVFGKSMLTNASFFFFFFFFFDLAPVVQRPDNFIRWIRHYSGSKISFTLNVVQGCRTLPNLTVVRVCIFACTRGNTENLCHRLKLSDSDLSTG